MFFGIEDTKTKNFFAICDSIASNPECTRNSLTQTANLSYPTVSKTVEHLLDIGIITERQIGKSYVYSFNKRNYIAVADLRGKFDMIFTDLGGHELSRIAYKESGAFYYDEKLSLFLRDSSIIGKRSFPKGYLCGVCVILPSIDDKYRDTRGILSSEARLKALVSSYFKTQNVCISPAVDAVSEMLSDTRSLIIMKEPSSVICRVIGYGCDNTGILKSVSTVSLGKCSSSDELAAEIAYSVGNLCDLLRPEAIYVDGESMFSASAFPRKFKTALASFNCVEHESLPPIFHTSGTLSISAGARLVRCALINTKIDSSKERKTP